MMKKTFKPLISLSLVAACAFGMVACSNSTTPEPTANPTETAGSPSVSPSSTPASPSPTSVSAQPVPVKDHSQELAAAQKAFPNLKVGDGDNKDDALLAVYAASRYVNTAYNSGYLANGSWAKDGGSGKQLYQMLGKDWSDSYRAKMDDIISHYHSSDPTVRTKAAQSLLYNMFYTDSTNMGNVSVPSDCNQSTIGAPSCLVEGSPQLDEPITYQTNHTTGNIIVSIVFTDNVKIISNGVSGVTVAKYNLQLEMTKDPYPDAKNFRYTYIVNDIAGNYTFNWHKGE